MSSIDTPILVNNFKANITTATVSAGATTFALSNTTGITGASPTSPVWLDIIDPASYLNNDETQTPEIIECIKVTAVGGLTLNTVARGQKGTTARAWVAGAVVVQRTMAHMISDIYDALTNGTKDLSVGALTAASIGLATPGSVKATTLEATGAATLLATTFGGDLGPTGAGLSKLFTAFRTAAQGILGTSPCGGPTAREIGTSGNVSGFHTSSLDFDKDTEEYAHFQFILPNDYDGRALTARLRWTAVAGTSGTVRWQIYAACYGDNTSPGSASVVLTLSDTFLATNKLHSISGTFTPGSSTAGKTLDITLRRNASNASDTFDADALFLMLEISYL